jgi:zinc D-Ala-D-Ala carboxypeptidase
MITPAAEEHPPRRCRNTAERRRLIERAHALGVPRQYGRTRHLRLLSEPARLVGIGRDIHGRQQWLQPGAAAAFAAMRAAASRDGLVLQVVSAFRSVEYQLGLLERKLGRGLTIEAILRVNAAPGYSEHHTGRAVDLTSLPCRPLDEEFERSPAFDWLQRNAVRFGFVLSFPRDNPHGIAYEPWHWCWYRQSPGKRAA